MPLGNLTSQFFANVYLNELDQFVKNVLRAKCYVRYVDDFVILHNSREKLEFYLQKINFFLKEKLKLELHPAKSRVINLKDGVDFLGFRIFYHHKLLRKKNLRKFERRFKEMKKEYDQGVLDREEIMTRFEGWLAYVSHADTYKYRRYLIRLFNQNFPLKPVEQINNLNKHETFIKKVEASNFDYSPQKTLHLFKKGLTIKEISEKRQIKISTVWEHFSQLIQANQFSIWKLLPKEKVILINSKILSHKDTLREIKSRISDNTVTYDEINCVLASINSKHKEKSITELVNWYRKTHCYRKCYFNQKQISTCKEKFNRLVAQNNTLEMKRKDFLNLFNNQMTICILPDKEKTKYMTWQEFKKKRENITTPQKSQF